QTAAHQRFESTASTGTNVASFIHETMLTPIQIGRIRVFAQGFTPSRRFPTSAVVTGPVISPAFLPQNTLLESDEIELEVRPLPKEGELPGFTGAVGSFALEPPQLATNVVRVGEPVKLGIIIKALGETNLARLVPPPPPRVHDWQVLPAA